MAVRHVVHQVDGWEERGVVQASAGVEEEMTRLLCVDSALNLAPIIVQLIECDSGVNVSVEVLHVVDLKQNIKSMKSCTLANITPVETNTKLPLIKAR